MASCPTNSGSKPLAVPGGAGRAHSASPFNWEAGEFSVRIASRHPDQGYRLFGFDDPPLQSVQADIQDERSVVDALAGAYSVVNTVSLYVEHGQETFHCIHVESAQRW